MNARILRAIVVVMPWIFGRWILHDIQSPLSQLQPSVTITPVIISASRRNFPTVSENRGKWFIQWPIKPRSNIIHTARHVISDTWYNYYLNQIIPLLELYHGSWDIAYANVSGHISSGASVSYTTWLWINQLLMAQYRSNKRSWLTGSIVWSGDGWIIADLAVLPGDSGSPVIFADKSVGMVSQSHSWDQVIVELIKKTARK